MVLYWIAFALALAVAALIGGGTMRIIARLKHWPRGRTQVGAYCFCWLIYFLVWLVQRIVPFHFLPHSLAELGGSFGSDLFALLLMGAFGCLAVQVAVIGSSAQGEMGGRQGLTDPK